MKKIIIIPCFLFVCSSLISCVMSNHQGMQMSAMDSMDANQDDMQMSNMNGGITSAKQVPLVQGAIGRRMDAIDRSKFSRGLDRPLGKATKWTNGSTMTTYTVVPTRKLTIDGNPLCRHYSVTAARGSREQTVDGAACVGQDSTWKPVY